MDEPESPEETIERIGRVPAEYRTRGQETALRRAYALIDSRAGARSITDAKPDARPRSTDAIPVVLDRIRDGIAREVDALLNGSAQLDTADRVKVLTAAAKVTGFTDANDSGDVPFTFRGWDQPDVVLSPGVTETCDKCGHVTVGVAKPAETTQGVVPEAL